jgi:hypothetical protein
MQGKQPGQLSVKWLGYGLDDRGIGFSFPARADFPSLLRRAQSGSGVLTASNPVGNKVYSPGPKAAGLRR